MIRDETVWAVGGQLRDKALGRECLDLDYAVEGSAIQFATQFAHKNGHEVQIYPAFNTATVFTGNRSLDFATCRTEYYKKPGKLPSCFFHNVPIEYDLERRDFTVNAIAQNTKTGKYITVPKAWHDLEVGLIRVLHDRSFIDDPTRMIRAIRYSVDLNFRIEPDTMALFDMSLFGTLGKTRLERQVSLGWRAEHWCLAEGLGIAEVIRDILTWPTCKQS